MSRFSGGGMSARARLSRGAAWIIGLELGMFLLYVFAGEATQRNLANWLVLTPSALLEGHVWKLVTTSLLNVRGLSLFFDILMLWMFIPTLEQFWGTKRFLVFLVATSLFGNLVSALVGLALSPVYPIVGLAPFIYASIAAFGIVFARQPVQFFGVIPIKGRQLAIGMLCFLLVFVLLESAWIDGAGYFAAIALAWGMTSGIWQPNVWWLKYRRWRRRYTVIDGGISSRDRKRRWMN